MKLGTGQLGSYANRYGGLIGMLMAFYQYYADRGIDGIMADAQAIISNPKGLFARVKELAVGIIVMIGTPMVAARVPNTVLKGLVKFVGNYYAWSQILMVVRQGYGGGMGAGRGYVASSAPAYTPLRK